MHAILLAAGRSSRMGYPKALLDWHGQPLVRYLAQTLRDGGAASLSIVVADAAVAAQAGEEALWNPAPERGMLSSVQLGVAAAPPDAGLLICPCDLPRLRADHVATLLRAWDGDGGRILTPTFESQRGHPVLFGPKIAAEIDALDPERAGLDTVVRADPRRVVAVPMPDDGPLRDADTPQAWRALRDQTSYE